MPFATSSTLARLIGAPVRPGRVVWIGIRPARRAMLRPVDDALLEATRGIVGDHYTKHDGARQVTLIEAESLASIASHLGRLQVEAADLRRNIVVRGINLLALKERQFRIGDALLATSGECHPCSRLEEAFGVGGYNAVRGLGGITARVLEGGRIRLCDSVVPWVVAG